MGKNDDVSIFLTRRGQYDKVWNKAMRKLGPEMGISDVGLKKLCTRFEIPTPPPGYWAKVAHGKKVRKPPFVKWPEDDDPEYGFTFPVIGGDSPPGERLAAEVKQQAEPITVPDELVDPHPLIVATQKSLRAAGKDDEGLVTPRAKKTLDVHVSPENIPRAMRIMDAFVKTLEARRLTVTVVSPEGDRQTAASVLQESVGFMLYEATEKVERKPTPQEREDDLYWRRESQYYRRVPSGRLGLRITSGIGWGQRGCWVDDRRRKLDVQLKSVLAALHRATENIKAERREAEEQERQRQQREREQREWEAQQQEKLEGIRQEEERLQQLMAEADSWNRAQQLRFYLQAVRHRASCQKGEILNESDLHDWLRWAEQQADRLDPLTSSPPSILDEKEKWERNPYRRW